jgi:hypothetical protein
MVQQSALLKSENRIPDSRVRRVDRFEFTGVELLVQKQLAVIRQSIKTARNALDEPILRQLRERLSFD